MKKDTKLARRRLGLTKESIQLMSRDKLEAVAGGKFAVSDTCPSATCHYSGCIACNSGEATCSIGIQC